jgi:uncharacterized membrane protein
MKISAKKIVLIFWSLFCLMLLAVGILFIFQSIPPNDFLGLDPGESYAGDEFWYELNIFTGWALTFCSLSTGMLMFALASRQKGAFRLFLSTFTALILSSFLSAIFIELVTKALNIY